MLMQRIQSTLFSSLAGLGMFVLATMAGDRAAAATKLHDPALNHETIVNGATNGNGIQRGPWVTQIAVAKGEVLVVQVKTADAPAIEPMVRAIAGDGSIYFADFFFRAYKILCIKAPVTGWMTVHVDIPGSSEQRIEMKYARSDCFTYDPPH